MAYTYIVIKVKDKGVLGFPFLNEHHAMKVYWGNRGITPCIPNLGNSLNLFENVVFTGYYRFQIYERVRRIY